MALTVLALAALAAACNSESDAEPGRTATVPTAAPTTTTTDPYALPEGIDEAYVNRVLEGLDAAFGDIVRLVVAERSITPEAITRLEAIYADPDAIQLKIDGLQGEAATGFSNFRPNPGNQISTVTDLISAQPSCIFAQIERDFSRVGVNSQTASVRWVALRALSSTATTPTSNPTGWAYVYDGFAPGRVAPPNPCAS